VPLYLTARGLTSSLIPHPSVRNFDIELDFVARELVVRSSDGVESRRPLAAEPVPDFYNATMSLLDKMGFPTSTLPMPVEIPGAVRFDLDGKHGEYDGAQAERFWLTLVAAQRLLGEFRGVFIGKSSPVHFFWGALDLAVTRFSGRAAPDYAGDVANCGPHAMQEAYSHEVSSCGFWPGLTGRGSTATRTRFPPPSRPPTSLHPVGGTRVWVSSCWTTRTPGAHQTRRRRCFGSCMRPTTPRRSSAHGIERRSSDIDSGPRLSQSGRRLVHRPLRPPAMRP
jgi:hypothetical protein